MIDFACPHCGRKLRVVDQRAGQKGKCPHCAAALVVPAPSGALLEAAAGPPRTAPSENATVPPKDGAGAPDGRRETHGEADATPAPRGERGGPSSELTDFLAPPQGPDEIGRLGPYRILKVLGAGGMGVVYQAEDPSLRRLIAVKAMLPALAASASARERFIREARSAAAVEHDHIVAIYQVGEDRGVPYLAMPFLRGEPLDARVKRDKRLPLAEVLRIARETAAGLEAARQRGMIHRDIKPANLWLEEGAGRVKILDFGLARTADDEGHLTQQGAILGTPSYMAPEQAGGKADHRADLFSLGCVIYRMATGELPFKGTDTISTLMAVATEAARPPIEINPRLPPALSDLILRLLAKKPDERPASAQAVVEAIRGIEANPKEKVKLPPPAAVRPTTKSGPQRVGGPATRSGPHRLGAADPKTTAARAGTRTAVRPPAPPRKSGGAVIVGLVALLVLAGLAVGGYFVWPYLPFSSSPSSPSDSASPPEKDKPDPSGAHPPMEADGSWRRLFNGTDLSGWKVHEVGGRPKEPKLRSESWGVDAKEGVLFALGADRTTDVTWLMTEKDDEFADFELHLDYRMFANTHANSGVAIRAPMEGDPSYTGMEIQIIDDAYYKSLPGTLRPQETTGSIFDVAAADKQVAKPLGQWNHMLIIAKGREVTVVLNDVRVLRANLDELHKRRQSESGRQHPGLLNPRGRIGLQSHTGRVEFKDIGVRPLSDK